MTSTDNYSGKLVVLAADIDMEGERYDVVSRAFAGTFDGQGHTITRWWANNNIAHGIGLFGWVEPDTTATVKNLVILNSTFRDLKWQVGGIFGEVRGTVNIENDYSELNIGWDWAPGGDIGGFVGRVDHDKAVVNIKNCVYAGEINNKLGTQGHFAGFVGTINKPAAQVNITDSAYYGKMLESNTRNAGFVSAVRGILNIDRCVSAGTVNHSGKDAVYFSCKHYDGCAVNVTNSLYAAQPGYNAYTATGATKLAKSAFIGENATATIAANQLTETWSAAYGYMLPKSLNTMLGADFKGAGSPAFSGSHWYTMETADETPELLVIDSVEDLIQFSEALEHPDLNFEGLTVEIAADLDLNAGFDASARPATAPAKVWKLVSGGRTFAGTIDGKGHTISGIYAVATDGANDYGLFGSAAGATVKNLSVVNSYVQSNGYSHGGLFGSVSGDSTIEAVYADIDVVNDYTNTSANGDLGIGGLVGAVTVTSSLTVKNTVFVGSVEVTKDMGAGGLRGAGGLVGVVNGSETEKNALTVENCGFFGTVNSLRNVVGGIVGAMGNFDDAPLVSVTNTVVGGVIYSGDLVRNGSFCGYIMSGTLHVTNSYYIKLNDAGEFVDRPAFGTLTAFETYEGATLLSDLSLRGTAASTLLTEKGLEAWQATKGYAMPTALSELLPDTLPGEGTVPNDEEVKTPDPEQPTPSSRPPEIHRPMRSPPRRSRRIPMRLRTM